MNDVVRVEDRPLWVKVGLWGLPNRSSAWSFFWLSILLAVGCVAYGTVDRRFYLGAGFLPASLWYFLAIRWVDRNSRWS